MDDEMRGRILEAETLARVGSGSDAMSIADQLTIQAPEELEVWMLRGYLHERSGNYVHAKSDFSQAIQCNNLEPHLFFCRGRFFYHLGELDEAHPGFLARAWSSATFTRTIITAVNCCSGELRHSQNSDRDEQP